jgi:hypothetical protein
MHKQLTILTAALVFGGWQAHSAQSDVEALDPGKTVLVEAEWFRFHGDWVPAGRLGQTMLWTMAGEDDPITVIEIPRAGDYAIWTQTYDYEKRAPSTRRYRLYVDEKPVEHEAPRHGLEGWHWEKIGQRELDAGEHVLRMHCTIRFPRVDAILFTTQDIDPNNLTQEDRREIRVRPTEVELRRVDDLPEPAAVDKSSLEETAVLENAHVRIVFLKGTDAKGQPQVIRRTEIKSTGGSLTVPSTNERLYLVRAEDSGLNVTSLHPAWANGGARLEFEAGGKTYETTGQKQNPFFAGQATLLVPRDCRNEAGGIRVEYESTGGQKVSGLWTLPEDARHVHFSATCRVPRDGEYMLAFRAFDQFEPAAIEQVQLPPRYQYQRLPGQPNIVTDSIACHPLALIQTRLEGFDGPVSLAVTGDMDQIPFEWPHLTNATYAFGLKNHRGKVQPCLFQPVLGLDDSKMKKGDTLEAAWNVLAWEGDWTGAFEYASSHLFQVTDYREPWKTSLSDAILNMFDLMADETPGGWDPNLRGRWNIESRATVSQAAPLMELSVALLTRDETYYEKYALPSIEFTLSRPFTHFSKSMHEEETWLREFMLDMTVPSNFFDSAYWQGVHALLGEANPWMTGLARETVQLEGRGNSAPDWSRLLALYRLDPAGEKLDEVRAAADAFIEKEIFGRKTGEFVSHFYNLVTAPYWFDLVDLYEETGDEKYLEAARAGAFLTMAGQFSIPATIDGPATIHEDFHERFKDLKAWTPWFKGPEHFALGWPVTPDNALKEESVPAWLVSRVGFSFEGPGTHQGGGKKGRGVNNIQLSCWAPDLLRVAHHTGRPIFRTYARNTTVGRWANWPGYYMSRFTDTTHDPRYPYEGPDVTSLYWHQLPAHTAYAMEYLVAEAETRSDYRIRLPWVRQQGYVWMTNRIYGMPGGEIFGDGPVVPRMSRGVRADSPMINVLLARSEETIWVILTNDAHRDVTTGVRIDPVDWAVRGLKKDAPARILDAGGETRDTITADHFLEVEVPALGLTALALPAQPEEIDTAPPPLTGEAHISQDLGEPWGQVHAFRIRDPFGKDSLYAVRVGPKVEGMKAELILETGGARTDTEFPQEFTVYPWAMDRDMTFRIRLTNGDGKSVETEEMTLKGTR